MRNLEDLKVPNNGEVSLGEINGCMQSQDYNYANLNMFTDTLDCYPKIHITTDLLQSSRDEGKALFLPTNVPFLKQIIQIYCEQGYVEALHLASTHNHVLISKSASIILTFLKYVNKLRTVFNQNINYSHHNTTNSVSQTRNEMYNKIKCISWHPNINKVAIVTCDDSVRLFGDNNAVSTLLQYKHQKNINCIAWRYMSNSEIAVGHENGITIWSIDANLLVSRPSISNALFLKRSYHKPIIDISWSPKGDKLVSCAACDNTILVWDIDLGKTSSLKRPGGSGNILVKWSPTGEKLFSSSTGPMFRVWNCYTWESEKWTVLAGRVQTACWSKCGTTLFFATTSEAVIYGLIIKADQILTSNFETNSTQAIPLSDTTKIDINGVTVGGIIHYMESDPKGKHLAVLFQDTNCVAIFNIVHQSTLQLIPSSLVVGLPEEKPNAISFVKNFEAGTCLTVGWSSGRIQYYPIIYSDLSGANQDNSLQCTLNTLSF